MDKPVTYLPAMPDFYLVEIDGLYEDVVLTPILGWAVSLDSYRDREGEEHFFTEPTPISYEAVADDWVVKTPDGKIIMPGAYSFDSKEDYLKHCKASDEADIKRKAGKP